MKDFILDQNNDIKEIEISDSEFYTWYFNLKETDPLGYKFLWDIIKELCRP